MKNKHLMLLAIIGFVLEIIGSISIALLWANILPNNHQQLYVSIGVGGFAAIMGWFIKPKTSNFVIGIIGIMMIIYSLLG